MREIAKDICLMPSDGKHKIVLYREAINPSVNQVNVYFDYLEGIVLKQKFHLIIDVSRSNMPSVEVRQTLKKRFKRINQFILSHNVYVGENKFIKIAVKFIAAAIGIKEFRVFSSVENAHKNILNEI